MSDGMRKQRQSLVWLDFIETYDYTMSLLSFGCGCYILYLHWDTLCELPILFLSTTIIMALPQYALLFAIMLSPLMMIFNSVKGYKAKLFESVLSLYHVAKVIIVIFNGILCVVGIMVFSERKERELAVFFIYTTILYVIRSFIMFFKFLAPRLYDSDVYLQELNTELYILDTNKVNTLRKEIKEISAYKQKNVLTKRNSIDGEPVN